MAIQKEVVLNNGIVVAHHRVMSVTSITNVENMIEVASYISSEKRREELESISSGVVSDTFIETEYIVVPYSGNMSISDAYAFLKTQPKYEGAIDVN